MKQKRIPTFEILSDQVRIGNREEKRRMRRRRNLSVSLDAEEEPVATAEGDRASDQIDLVPFHTKEEIEKKQIGGFIFVNRKAKRRKRRKGGEWTRCGKNSRNRPQNP